MSQQTTTKVAPGIYSFASPAQLARLRIALESAYPHERPARRRQRFITYACQPGTIERFIEQVNRINRENI